MRLAIDAMGGDNAPKEVVLGVMEAVKQLPDVEFTLVGDEAKIREHLTSEERIHILHTDEVIEADEEPVRAVRRKKNSSMVLMAQEVKEGRAAACISAGNTGALMAAGLFVVGRIKGIERPALSPTLPTVDGQGFVMLDVGANVDAKPEHLYQYAVMGSIYAEKVRAIPNPRVGLLNVGTEDKKGNDLAKQAFALLQNSNLNFVGNVEARDLMSGVADVVVTDGFTGNVALKSMEGTALAMFSILKAELTSTFTSKLAAGLLKPQFKSIKNRMDYSEHGGASLFGLNAPVIKAHGSSTAKTFYHTIRQAHEMANQQVSTIIRETIEKEGLRVDE
ncbi:phosphate acyltransferase PlsX [Priestia taiwanensis]|uniref:Phosphate acyltransferase n=1 Tax=Priestia taiwanensis TaxID=1347902 RepID=A0A917APJ1_9BACI|nr:phosphate acyltransferase PlsX [Priestia taiwanensis]MBM7362875.1 glycerol-3-phosphate acyltransferase PlsX [Priestia taiwanensis]GGE65832.1 phosphate acyltransferase [Priestia taiwanensis]